MRLYNGIGRQLRRFGWRRRLTLDSILQAARRWTGLADWGDERFFEPLERLLHSFEEDARLNSMGRLLIKLNCVHFASNRLRLQHALTAHPEILEQPVKRPLFVVGMPRTGTTLLHNLLCQDSRSRPLLLWEALWPVPPERSPEKRDPRPARAQRLVRFMTRWGTPQLEAVHPLDAHGPEECTFLLFNTFMTPAFFLNGNVRGYIDWLGTLGAVAHRRIYEEYRQYLQLLGWQRPAGHWALKAPVHSFALDALLTLFPDAAVVQTHRDMAKVVPSACSLFGVVQGLYSDDVDSRRLGPDVAKLLSTHMLEPAMKAREAHPGRVFDVHYKDLIRDPIQTVAEIYNHFGYDLDESMRDRMQRWQMDNAPYKHGAVHQYDLDQFGLTPRDIDRIFASYRDQFDIVAEAAPPAIWG
jgi:hypothetical protein